MKTIRIPDGAIAPLAAMAEAAGVTIPEFVNALLTYAYSQHRRPGSWEASVPFDASNYFGPDAAADRWWHS